MIANQKYSIKSQYQSSSKISKPLKKQRIGNCKLKNKNKKPSKMKALILILREN